MILIENKKKEQTSFRRYSWVYEPASSNYVMRYSKTIETYTTVQFPRPFFLDIFVPDQKYLFNTENNSIHPASLYWCLTACS